MRVWRAVKSLGCGSPCDGVHLLPKTIDHERALTAVLTEIQRYGGTAELMSLSARDAAQEQRLRALFDREADYGALREALAAFTASVVASPAVDAARQLRTLKRRFDALAAIDFYPGSGRTAAKRALDEAHVLLARLLHSPNEPRPAPGRVPRLDTANFQRRVWATRKRPWIDRLASAWLICRHIDPKALFVWLEKPEDCRPYMLGFDFNGAAFTHVGRRVTFETLLESFGLEGDPALRRIAAIVHYLDAGGQPDADAAGVQTVLTGARAQTASDDRLLAEALKVFDMLYASYQPRMP
jgi:hypothetical protein